MNNDRDSPHSLGGAHQPLPTSVSRPRLGRSGPRLKTGCLTCRRRKVRCDEGRPSCAHCNRLRLRCIYSQNNTRVQDDRDVSGKHCRQCKEGSKAIVAEATDDIRTPSDAVAQTNDDPARQSNGLDLPGLNPTFPSSLLDDELWDFVSNLNPMQDAGIFSSMMLPSPESSEQDDACYKARLSSHFLSLVSPPRLVMSIDMDWKSFRDYSYSMSETFDPLKCAIYAFADAHLSKLEHREALHVPANYDKGSTEVEAAMTDDIGEIQLKQSIATILFLIFVEVLTPTRSTVRPAFHHFRSAHIVIHRFRSRLSHWRGMGQKMMIWLTLLDQKATFAGREGPVLEDFPEVTRRNEAEEQHPEEDGLDHSSSAHSTTDLIFRTLNQVPFAFYLKTQQFSRRITLIDKWHRTRGSLDDELEVLQIGKLIEKDLERHWSQRPAVLDQCLEASQLLECFQGPLAKRFASVVRQYRAAYFTHIVYVHRVAFRAYPRQPKVDHAMDEVLNLAKVDAVDGVLPSAWLWPLFMVGLEADLEDRTWIISEFKRMCSVNDVDHPGAARALQILETVTSRQDAGDTEVDSQAVRKELFQGDLDVM